jgi:hypothetical protein
VRILITNNTLAERAGTELYVRDVAIALLRRGHSPIAYSQVLGDVAAEMRAATVPVVDDLRLVTEPPDVIHGHHHLETMTALLHYPGVPAVFFCHGWLPWQEAPPIHPGIVRYVAVDELCRQRLLDEGGVPPDRAELMLNFVDLERFRPRPPLPSVPRRALLLANTTGARDPVEQVRRACAAVAIDLDVVGSSSANATPAPERLLPTYDLVFAKGRTALEAMAVGCAVILWSPMGSGPLVDAASWNELRPLNFGLRALSRPATADALAAQISRYDPDEAAAVGALTRREAGLSDAIDRLLTLYASAKGSAPGNATEAGRAMARYIRGLAPAIKENEALRLQRDEALAEAARWRARAEAAEQARAEEVEEMRRVLQAADAEKRESLTDHEASLRAAEDRTAALEAEVAARSAEASSVREELARAYGTLTWRLRERVLAVRVGRFMQRLLRRRR